MSSLTEIDDEHLQCSPYVSFVGVCSPARGGDEEGGREEEGSRGAAAL